MGSREGLFCHHFAEQEMRTTILQDKTALIKKKKKSHTALLFELDCVSLGLMSE